MKTPRALALLLPFAALAVVPFACSPSTSNAPPTCINAVAGLPDGSIHVNCAWDGGSSETDLSAAFNHLLGDAGTCMQDSDCVFLTDGGQYAYDGFHAYYLPPVALANVEGFTQAAQDMICGFQRAVYGDAGASLSDGVPGKLPESAFCLVCDKVDGGPTGQCVANQIMDGGM